jgi:hypothetical protein
MSLSFPTGPSVGQIYQGFAWDGARWTSPWGGGSLVNSYNGRVGAVLPMPADIQSGSRVLISSQTVSTAVANVSFTTGVDSTYVSYELECRMIVPTVDAGISFRFHDGTAFDASTSYTNAYIYNLNTNANAFPNSGAANNTTVQVPGLHGVGSLNNCLLRFFRPAAAGALPSGNFTSNFKNASYFGLSIGDFYWVITAGRNLAGVQVLYLATTITAGTINLYGIKP